MEILFSIILLLCNRYSIHVHVKTHTEEIEKYFTCNIVLPPNDLTIKIVTTTCLTSTSAHRAI